MPPQVLRKMLQDFMQAIQILIETHEILPDEFWQQVNETLNLLAQRISEGERITGGHTIETPGHAPPPPGQPSSNVAGMAYDPKNHNMVVQFLGKHPNRNGPVYKYPNIPPQIAELLQAGAIPARTNGQNKWGKWWKGKSPSAGASVFTLLKNRNAPFQRLS